jgi:hypothetical protein
VRKTLLLILLLAAGLRLYQAPDRFTLGVEGVRDGFVANVGAQELQLPLTGPFSSLGPFTFGPLYYYQLIIFTLILRSPEAPWLYLELMSLVFVFFCYKCGRLVRDEKLGLIAAFLAAISPGSIYNATALTNISIVSTFAVVAIFMFLMIIRGKTSRRWYFGLGLVIGVGTSAHYQMAAYFLLPVWLLFFGHRRRVIDTILGIFLTFIPLLVFDLLNRWFTVRNILDFVLYRQYAIYIPNRWLFYLRDFWPSFWSATLGTPIWLTVALVIAFAATVRGKLMFCLVAIFGLEFIALRYYRGERFYGYLQYFYPFIFIFSAYPVWFLTQRKKLWPVALGVLLLLVVSIFPQTIIAVSTRDGVGVSARQIAVGIEKAYPNSKVDLYYCDSSDDGLAKSVLFVLYAHGRLDANGKKVGVDGHSLCRSQTPGWYELNLVNMVGTRESWYHITPEMLYNDSVRWWIKEKL